MTHSELQLKPTKVPHFMLTLPGTGPAQTTWTGRIYGLPKEAEGVALYLIDFEALEYTLAKGVEGSETLIFRAGGGELFEDGTFRLTVPTAAALDTGLVLSATRFKRLMLSCLDVSIEFPDIPEDARLALPVFIVENRQGLGIGSILPRFDGIKSHYPTPLLAVRGQNVQEVSAKPDAVIGDRPEYYLYFDLEVRADFKTLKSARTSDSSRTWHTMPRSPQTWDYEPLPKPPEA